MRNRNDATLTAMTMKTILQNAWDNFWILSKKRSEPWWARAIVTARLGLWMSLFMLAMMLLMVLATDSLNPRPFDFIFWWLGLRDSTFEGFSVAYVILPLLRCVELLLPDSFLKRVSAAQDWRYGTILIAVTTIGVAGGMILGVGLIGLMESGKFLFGHGPEMHTYTLWFLVMIAAINLSWWRLRLRHQSLRYQTSEAQLRLLQAQIEPHFLFNTLANVQSLMDHDASRAKQLLEGFTDYLRASLGQLRNAETVLEAELDMARNYLQLMTLRMEERLAFVIEASEEARMAMLPTLLLQPLIENAIQHGLEPKVEGGTVRIDAQVQAGRLRIRVADDGLGLDGHSRSLRRGNGVALENLRERLHTRYGTLATFILTANAGQHAGACALLDLPYESDAKLTFSESNT
jgi:hypothetical protein